jgi:hypothetical protein
MALVDDEFFHQRRAGAHGHRADCLREGGATATRVNTSIGKGCFGAVEISSSPLFVTLPTVLSPDG